MFDKRAVQVLQRLNAAGYEAYFVGGCVRDMLRGSVPHDFDVASSALPEQTLEVFADHPVIQTGLRHGTVTVLWEGLPVEVTTYRTDGAYSDGRHPDAVCFTASLNEDLARRDFTVNAMAWRPESGLQDPFGGQSDLTAGVLRCVGDPERRFSEDGLRILRALRFRAVLGYRIEWKTDRALRQLRERLTSISPERVRHEFELLICGEYGAAVLEEYPEVIGVFLPELLPTLGFDQKNKHHCYDVYTHLLHALSAAPSEPVLRWAALLHDVAKPVCFSVDETGTGHFYAHAAKSAAQADNILRRLRCGNRERERIVTLIRHHDAPVTDDPAAIRRKLNKLGEEAYFQLIALQRADTLALAPEYRCRTQILDRAEKTAREILAEKQCFSLRDLAVNGNDLLDLGYFGKAVGEGLSFLLNEVLEGRVKNEKEALLSALKEKSLP